MIRKAHSNFLSRLTSRTRYNFTINPVNRPYVCTESSLNGTLRKNWMEKLKSNIKVSELSIPGTHDSGTYALSNISIISKTQSLDTTNQLEAGICFLDLRVDDEKGRLKINHGIIKVQDLSLVVYQIREFIRINPSEILIVAFQGQDHDGTDAQKTERDNKISKNILEEFKKQGVELFFSRSIPTVEEVRARGGVWALSGYHISFGGSTYSLLGSPGIQDNENVYVQNYYYMSNSQITYDLKWKYVSEAAFKVPVTSSRMKFNFLSGSIADDDKVGGFLEGYLPYKIAENKEGPNCLLNQELKTKTDAELGVTIMDFPGDQLIGQIVNTNKKHFQ